MHCFLFLTLVAFSPPESDPGPFVRALWLVQQLGTAESCDPANDIRIKSVLSHALTSQGELTVSKLEGMMQPESIKKLTAVGGRIDADTVRSTVEAAVPASRSRLLPRARQHLDYLTTTFDAIDEKHREAARQLAEWIAKNYHPGEPLHAIVVCTGNSRRSILGATMGNMAAAYYGMPEIRFSSGGTTPSAFNKRTIVTLQEIGVEVQATGKEVPPRDPKIANPIYLVRWGNSNLDDSRPMETLEFSKVYSDPANPQSGFAALMVCDEADAACPLVKGSAVRISMPYLDPKIYDDGAFEKIKYAERRDDLGRFMLSVMLQAQKRRL
jgi:protein-tyrosine-phosphatase